jgi:sorbitol/mannitol transport system substrate-binding protein
VSRRFIAIAGALSFLFSTPCFAQTTLTIGTIPNRDMIRLQRLSGSFTAKNPDIAVKWVTLGESVLQQRVINDIATKGGQFDILTIGSYEVPIWAKQNWLVALDKLGPDYDVADLLPNIRDAVSIEGKLYAAPFYGESSIIMYRRDLFQRAGLRMPVNPTWHFVIGAAKELTDKTAGIYGICLRGEAGWNENMAFLTAMANSFGARWFDEKWQPQFNSPEWSKILTVYIDLMRKAGPPRAGSNGFDENLALFSAGKCGMWIDTTAAAASVTDPKDSKVADKVGFALAPNSGFAKNTNWLWAWNLAIPAGSKKVDAAKRFIAWATSTEYQALVAAEEGWANVPAGTRASLYRNPEYLKAAPFAKVALASINLADPIHPTLKPVPYVGAQYVSIPEFQVIGNAVGQQFSAALVGTTPIHVALAAAQSAAEREMKRAGYIK